MNRPDITRAELKREEATEAAWRIAPTHCRGCRYCVPEWDDSRFDAWGPDGKSRCYGNIVLYPVCVLLEAKPCPEKIDDCPKYARPENE